MIVAKIVGNVVSTNKADRLTGKKLLVVQPVDMVSLEPDGKPLVSIDTVGSGVGEIVMVVGGSSARQTELTKDTPIDSAIVGVIDSIEIDGKETFHKR
ncbi:EutN/CcmL family microcompartment protein [Pseudogracilibacillus auburnensis]|uniref:Ethanolamine utilization protein EutN/carbon dioxide concentrating mechanism protein CcmL n=1 Tax=Pseudogracilibacillus auburnensis TaxID=1494959 RepID=A0A2V3VX56_9BACI|nr:EutN/CcmL family microcompartment protein [Pseudogracilibacillus auburnensis]MBO1005819.1 EutN/CcmL family microcompartment protein [Pseudogracilibacillus auburnensis]PXW85524.1 ethanolamine utilization protein EutN/carbon dioxide concentrating mechanism protein CcmL [Pseudogracilibacillus auburnensis]